MRYLLLVLLLLGLGCSEDLRRGDPNSPNYISPKIIEVKVVKVEPVVLKYAGSTEYFRKPYTIVEDKEGARYYIPGEVGEVGEVFLTDVSLKEKL